jgi:hypothetical protein
MYQDTPEVLPVSYQMVQQAPAAQRWPGGRQAGRSTTQPQWPCQTNCTERSPTGVKRLEGAQDDLSDKEDDNGDIDKDKDNNQDN